MNIPIEYLLRKNRVEDMLCLPCSLFLRNVETNDKLVVLLTEELGGVVIRHINPTDATLNPQKQLLISKKEIFDCPDVIIPGYKLLEFHEAIFDHETKQVAELPLAAIQENQYREFLGKFYSPMAIQKSRENWLWECFEQTLIPKHELRRIIHESIEIRRPMFIAEKNIGGLWDKWRHRLLPISNPAAELIFYGRYKRLKMPKRSFEDEKARQYRLLFESLAQEGHIDPEMIFKNKKKKKNKSNDI